MKHFSVVVASMLLLSGCATREYYNIHKKSNDIETDKARCSYYAESRVPEYRPLVTINIHNKMSKEQRKKLEVKRRQREQQREMRRNRKVRQMRDYCLKAKGWRWRMVE